MTSLKHGLKIILTTMRIPQIQYVQIAVLANYKSVVQQLIYHDTINDSNVKDVVNGADQ